MRITAALLLAMACTGCSAADAVPTVPEPEVTIDPRAAEIIATVAESFSTVPLGTPLAQVAASLAELPPGRDCATGLRCYSDSAGVRHHFRTLGQEEVLAEKVVVVADLIKSDIGALGIGTARARGDVLANIRTAFPRLRLDCDPDRASQYIDAHRCGGGLGQGWLELTFDDADHLAQVNLSASATNP